MTMILGKQVVPTEEMIAKAVWVNTSIPNFTKKVIKKCHAMNKCHNS